MPWQGPRVMSVSLTAWGPLGHEDGLRCVLPLPGWHLDEKQVLRARDPGPLRTGSSPEAPCRAVPAGTSARGPRENPRNPAKLSLGSHPAVLL